MSAILKPHVGLRPMHEGDLESIMNIETDTYRFPWTRGIFLDCLHVGYSCWVYESEAGIEAYGVMSIGAGEAHILTVVVYTFSRGKGLGKLMMQHLLEIAKSYKVHTVLLEVRPSNKVAIHLYHSLGFNEVGTRPNYYPAEQGREDALIMAMTFDDNMPIMKR
jgi:ribosomal-protein-alanine N-acetyltransferase